MVIFCRNDTICTPSVTNDRKTTQKQIITIIIIAIIKKEEGGEFIGSYAWEG